MLASELYALSYKKKCEGPFQCHWCSAPCTNDYIHDEPIPVPFQKKPTRMALRPGNPYVCTGCTLWRRKRVESDTLTGKQPIVGTPERQSWLITKEASLALPTQADLSGLYPIIMKPPQLFVLAILDEIPTHNLQFFFCNNLPEIKGDTPISYTIDDKLHHYTIYEMEQGIRFSSQGLEPGARLLLDLLREPPADLLPPLPSEKEGKGRPPHRDNMVIKKITSDKDHIS